MAFTYIPWEKKEYKPGDSVNQAQDALKNHQANKPGDYQSQWQQGMNDLLSKYQNRGPFQYDINADAMYQQMVDRYMQQGQQAMMDTVGQVTALTGGYGNSYAQTAGQQTYQGYLQGANDMMPQFYKMALDRYQMEGDDLLQQYGLLADQENTAYNRYMDDVNRYYSELDRLQGIYESERDYDYNRFSHDQAFDYGIYSDEQDRLYQLDRDATEDQRWQEQWQYQQDRDKIQDEQWQREFDESIRQYNENMAWQREQAERAAARRSSGGGRGGSSGSGKNYSLIDEATSVAKKYGIDAGYKYIEDNQGADGIKNSEIAAAKDQVKGVEMTEYYRKMMAGMKKR